MKRSLALILTVIMTVALIPSIVIAQSDKALNDAPYNRAPGDIVEREIYSNTIATGTYTGAAIKEDGTLWMWGSSGAHLCGLVGDEVADENDHVQTPVQVLEGVISISMGRYTMAAIKNDATLWTWGSNSGGALGQGVDPNEMLSTGTPAQILEDVAQVSMGYAFGIALKSDGTVWTWGLNLAGQIGDGSRQNRLSPVQVLENAVYVNAGSDCAFAIKADGSVWSWGSGQKGKLGTGSTADKTTPTHVLRDYEVDAVYSAYGTTTFVTKEGVMYGMGGNMYGIIMSEPYGYDVKIFNPVELCTGVVQVGTSSRSDHVVVLRDDGLLYCWGENVMGCSNMQGYTYVLEPHALEDDEGTDFSDNSMGMAGYRFSLGLGNDGELWSWGYNVAYQLGYSTDGESSIYPQLVMTDVKTRSVISTISVTEPEPDPEPIVDSNVRFDGTARITFEAYDTWGYDLKFQMLIDTDGDFFETYSPAYFDNMDYYDQFEVTLPEGATSDPYGSAQIEGTSVTMDIPAGIYDYYIVQPNDWAGN